MSWTLLLGLVLVLGLALLAGLSRNAELARMRRSVAARDRAVRHGAGRALLQHPVVDLSRCLGCGTCVAACPEDDVLELVHGQAMVVNGAHCRGVSACERECPVGAITVTLQNLEERRDVPALTPGLEAIGSQNLFLAGEVTAHALVKTAVDHGVMVAAEVARRTRAPVADTGSGAREGVLDLCIVGAGPAGLACSLEARRQGLDFVTLDQEHEPGGTVAQYPRRKLVLTQPVDLPLVGRLDRASYSKEELIDLWRAAALRHALPIEGDRVFSGLEREPDGTWVVRTQAGLYRARHVCLALGRRGTPRKLGVPGEDLPKVAYSLLDATSYAGRRILVVGGGDSAVEAAMGPAEQPGTEVTLSYRKEGFFRIRSRNEERLQACLAEGRLTAVLRSELLAIRPDAVDLAVETDAGRETCTLENDEVFVMAGGVPPLKLLERSGVSFDPALREKAAPVVEQGTGLVRALAVGFALSCAALLWALWHADYYLLPAAERPAHPMHQLLRPGLGLGLALGIAATVLIGVNLLYLLRRSPRVRFNVGSLQGWMTSHVATGILALLCATLHGAMQPRETVGGHAFWALAALLVTGAIGRYFYAYVPRAANGRELELAEVKALLGRASEQWEQGQRRFRARAREEVDLLIERRQWRGTLAGRALALCGVQLDLRRALRRLAAEGRREGVAEDQIAETMALARRAHRTALMAAHYEDLRAVLNTWRYLHRWFAVLMVVLVVLHVLYALTYGAHFFETRLGGLS
jgi:dihydropyrimidine dehydrogenase (NAD+) subunit PreT